MSKNININEEKEIFETSDFYLSCYLYANDARLVNSIAPNGKTIFIFSNKNNNVIKLIDLFYEKDNSYRKYIHAIKDLKSIIYKNYKKGEFND